LQSLKDFLTLLNSVRNAGFFVIFLSWWGVLNLVDYIREEMRPFNLNAVSEAEAGEVYCAWQWEDVRREV